MENWWRLITSIALGVGGRERERDGGEEVRCNIQGYKQLIVPPLLAHWLLSGEVEVMLNG